jgi:hypothetical protein
MKKFIKKFYWKKLDNMTSSKLTWFLVWGFIIGLYYSNPNDYFFLLFMIWSFTGLVSSIYRTNNKN